MPRMLQDKYRNCCKFLAFFLQIGLHVSCIFCIFILAIKMDLHFFAFFLHPDFWGSIFQLHVFCIFLHLYLVYVSQKEAQPDHTNIYYTYIIHIHIYMYTYTLQRTQGPGIIDRYLDRWMDGWMDGLIDR